MGTRQDKDEIDEMFKRQRSVAFFETTSAGFSLLEVVRYSDKARLVDGLTKLLGTTPAVPDIAKEGRFSRGGFEFLGGIDEDSNPAQLELPDWLRTIDVSLIQLYSFCYAMSVIFTVKPEQREPISKKEYEDSRWDGDGSGAEVPKWATVQRGREEWGRGLLAKFCPGIYSDSETPLPIFRLMITKTTPKRDEVSGWFDNHREFLEYLGAEREGGEFFSAAVFQTRERLFGSAGFPRGMIFFCPYDPEEEEGGAPPYATQTLFSTLSARMFSICPYYWAIWRLNNLDTEWQAKMDGLMSKSEIPTDPAAILRMVRKADDRVLEFYRSFSAMARSTRRDVDEVRTRGRQMAEGRLWGDASGVDKVAQKSDSPIFEALSRALHASLKQIESELSDIERGVDIVLGYQRDLTNNSLGFVNITLQKRVMILTVLATVLAALAVLGSYDKISTAVGIVWSWLRSL